VVASQQRAIFGRLEAPGVSLPLGNVPRWIKKDCGLAEGEPGAVEAFRQSYSDDDLCRS
jgi:hypothetical protein